MAIEIVNETDQDVDTTRLLALGRHLFGALDIHPEAELSVLCVDEEAMEQLHLEWMDLPGPTDVMSFPMDELRPGTSEQPSEGLLGDIVICPQVAQAQAQAGGHSTGDEIALLMTHGMLHLLGYDHATEEERTEMFDLQNRILGEFLGYPAPELTVPDEEN